MDEKLKEALAKAADAGDFETELGFAEFFSSLKASGFAIVPREPTEEMLKASLETTWIDDATGLGIGPEEASAKEWRAMIAAFEGE